MGDFYTEIEVRAGGPISDEEFEALADELYALDAADPDVTDADLGVRASAGIARFSMTVTVDGPADAVVKALATVRAVIHAAGGRRQARLSRPAAILTGRSRRNHRAGGNRAHNPRTEIARRN
jgi:hypothetical protein